MHCRDQSRKVTRTDGVVSDISTDDFGALVHQIGGSLDRFVEHVLSFPATLHRREHVDRAPWPSPGEGSSNAHPTAFSGTCKIPKTRLGGLDRRPLSCLPSPFLRRLAQGPSEPGEPAPERGIENAVVLLDPPPQRFESNAQIGNIMGWLARDGHLAPTSP